MDASALGVFIQYLNYNRLIIDYAYVAVATALLYDFCLMVHLEIEVIWRTKWTRVKVLYLFARYIPIVEAYFMLRNQMFHNNTAVQCRWIINASTWLAMIGLMFLEILLALRTWAVCNRDFRVGMSLTVLQLCSMALNFLFVGRLLSAFTTLKAPYTGFRGCQAIYTIGRSWFSVVFITGAIEMTVFVIMATGAFKAYRIGYNSEFVHIVHLDAIKYYIFMLSITLLSLIFLYVLPPNFETLFLPMKGSMFSVFMSRIIINIRVAGKNSGAIISMEVPTSHRTVPQDELELDVITREDVNMNS